MACFGGRCTKRLFAQLFQKFKVSTEFLSINDYARYLARIIHEGLIPGETKDASESYKVSEDWLFRALLQFMWVRNWLNGLQEAQ